MCESLSQRFSVLDKALISTQEFWRTEPFHSSINESLPWLNHPALCEFLTSLEVEDIEQLKGDTSKLVECLTPFIPALTSLWAQCELDSLLLTGEHDTQHLSVGIPGRKWQQITAMGEAALRVNRSGQDWLEWCAGKGYLGQWLAQQSQLPVISFEWQDSLYVAGQALADKHQLSMTFIQGDALSDDCHRVFKPNQHAVALHACGDLHAHLIEHVCQQGLSGVTLSPCCYHLIQDDDYQPLSTLGKHSQLHLSKTDLRIPLQETVTGGERVKRHRELEMTYRLGFDCLLQDASNQQGYTSIPSIKKSQLSQGFASFCQWAKEQRNLDVTLEDLDYWQQRAQQRFIQMERLSLVQQAFRRPLEMWLVCDKALRLEQAGYDVSLSTFCPRDITPRNILIQAIENRSL